MLKIALEPDGQLDGHCGPSEELIIFGHLTQ